MRLPAGWVIGAREDGTGLIARLPSTNEEVHVTQYQSKAEHAGETPTQHIQRFVDEQSPPDPESPEVKDVVPFAPFDMPSGEPATMRIQDLGGNEFAVQYAIALPAGELYAVNFYCTGYSESAVSTYSKIVRNARIAPDATVTLNRLGSKAVKARHRSA